MILRDADRMLAMMDNSPYRFVVEQGYRDIPDHLNVHRTFFTENLKHFLAGLHVLYKKFDTLDNFCRATGAADSEFPAWKLAENINIILADANNGNTDSRCLPLNTNQTALKRLNMALRWLVRNDGIVDLGVWKSLTPAQLFIPLDVHVANVSRDLGLLSRKSNDRKAVIELTERLRKFRPDDPVYYDYALFGIGVTGRRGGAVITGFFRTILSHEKCTCLGVWNSHFDCSGIHFSSENDSVCFPCNGRFGTDWRFHRTADNRYHQR